MQGRVARAKPQREDVVMLSSDDEAQMSFLSHSEKTSYEQLIPLIPSSHLPMISHVPPLQEDGMLRRVALV